MDERKRIQINPEFFKLDSSSTKRRGGGGGGRKKAPSANAAVSAGQNISHIGTRKRSPAKSTSETLKKQLLKKIRDQQLMEEKGGFSSDEEGGGVGGGGVGGSGGTGQNKSEFENSLQFFENMMRENKTKGMVVSNQHENVSLSMPDGFKTGGGSVGAAMVAPPPAPPVYAQVPTSSPEIARQIQPQHGCLKGGALPTYRNWITQKNHRAISGTGGTGITFNLPAAGGGAPHHPPQFYSAPPSTIYNATIPSLGSPPPNIPTFGSVTDISPTAESIKNNIQRLMETRQREEANKAAAGDIPLKQKKTIRRTFQVGRSKKRPVVSVLVTNKTIRKKTMTNIQNLATVPIHEIKSFLQKKGLIKVGSVAPPHVLRNIYDNVYMLGGDIVNHNKDTLLHNFIMGAGGDEENK
jgi:hypothetical protein